MDASIWPSFAKMPLLREITLALIMKMAFHLCIPRALLKRGITEREAAKPAFWQTLPFCRWA